MAKSRKIRPLTERQRTVWEFIAEEISIKGIPPTLREIGVKFDIGSTNGARALLEAIQTKGFLKRHPYLSRGIEILKWPKYFEPGISWSEVTKIPIVGQVAAGSPILAEENIEGELLIDRSLFPAGDGFGLRVKGQSMIHAGINDGDIVLARPDIPVAKGNIVVALIDDEATVKYYYPENGGVRLEPGNPGFDPIIIPANQHGFRIVGKVVGLFRRY
ncbi:transcriptional repressor LexA [bacterium]|nr:transcriptional repressor LexA [bacterium]